MKNRHIILTLSLLLFSAAGLFAKNRDERRSVRVSGFELIQERGQAAIGFTLAIGEKAVARGNTLSIIPVLRNGGNALEFKPVVVRGRRAELLFKRRAIASPRTAVADDFIVAKNGESVTYRAVIPFEEWMAGSTLTLDGVDEGCCSAVRTNLGLIAQGLMVFESDFTVEEQTVIPGREFTTGQKLAELFPFVKLSGSGESLSRDGIMIYFHQGRNDVAQEYRLNRQSLVDILSVVEELQRSNDSEVESIVITGFASPEGGHEYNLRLSERRAREVRQFIFDNSDLPAERISINAGGEDWEGLRELVVKSDMPDKDAVLEIIDNFPVWDSGTGSGREGRLMSLRGGEPYRYMYDNLFPDLREAAYITIFYRNK